MPPWFKQHRAWLIVGLTILLVLCIRVRVRNMPLERDEGEYACAGQLILQGVPPYKEAYNMKLPGTYAAYAVIMALFGQTASAIHFGVALINTASIVLLFLIGRKILDEVAGVVAAISFALLSTSQSVLGLAGHATHFVVLPALAGTLVLLRARERALNQALAGTRSTAEAGDAAQHVPTARYDRPSWAQSLFTNHQSLFTSVFLSGILFGLAFLMKQHGIFFGIFGGLYLVFSHLYQPRTLKEKREQKAGGSGAVSPPRRDAHNTAQNSHQSIGPGSLKRPRSFQPDSPFLTCLLA
jgi:hypothetical protein